MNWLKKLTVFLACILFITCGIQEIYYLPQVPPTFVETRLNTDADIRIPSLSYYYYAGGYRIFYRIYISDNDTVGITQSDINNISSILVSDFNYFASLTDPTNTSSIPNNNTFINRSYFELELEGITDITTVLTTAGGNVAIQFPSTIGERPVLKINENEYILCRSSGRQGQTFSPVPEDRYFFSSPELNDYANANSTVNADVAGRSGASRHAYVCMYIVATGQNPENFNRIYSKPTLISIFKLPSRN